MIILILLLIIVFLYFGIFKKENFKQTNKNNVVKDPCTDFLSDKDYLIHMIPHHQVAIDMCKMMIPLSKSKTIQNIYRTIIWNQNIEILFMKQVNNDIPLLSGEIPTIHRDTEFKTSLSNNKKSIPKDYYCDPLFFKPNDHSAHMNHMKHTDKSFLEHMIPHHQVAIVMSNRLLKHTNNTYMIKMCYEIITAQRSEILKMNYILDDLNKNKLEFLQEYY
jgi:uncharacterized protein (DUF305 family)